MLTFLLVYIILTSMLVKNKNINSPIKDVCMPISILAWWSKHLVQVISYRVWDLRISVTLKILHLSHGCQQSDLSFPLKGPTGFLINGRDKNTTFLLLIMTKAFILEKKRKTQTLWFQISICLFFYDGMLWGRRWWDACRNGHMQLGFMKRVY